MKIFLGAVTFEEASGPLSRGQFQEKCVRILRFKANETEQINILKTICELTDDEPSVSKKIGWSATNNNVYFVFEDGLSLGDVIRDKRSVLSHDALKKMFVNLTEATRNLNKMGVSFSKLEEDDLIMGSRSSFRAKLCAENLHMTGGSLEEALKAMAALFLKIPISGTGGESDILYKALCIRLKISGEAFNDDPYFWTDERFFMFISNVSDIMKDEQNLMNDFDSSHKGEVFQKVSSWTAGINDKDVRNMLNKSIVPLNVGVAARSFMICQRVRKVSFHLRAIRNLSTHIVEYKGQIAIMNDKSTFRAYISQRWPTLLLFTYEFAKSDNRLSFLLR